MNVSPETLQRPEFADSLIERFADASLTLDAPALTFDLPAGGRRLVQDAKGYVATVCSGVVTFEGGAPTGAMPGQLVRGPRSAPEARA